MAVAGPPGAAGGRMIAGSLRPFTTRASHHVSAEGACELVKAPPGRCRQDRVAAGRFPQPLVSVSQPARSGRCGSQPLAFAVMTSRGNTRQFAARDDRWAPGTRVARVPACMDAHMAGGWPAEAAATVGVDALARRAPMPGLAGWHLPSDLRAPGHGRASCVLRAPIAGPSDLHGG
jgi:hypothetical protein